MAEAFMRAYKLFRVRKDGTLGSLFINAKDRLPIGEWLEADCHPTNGFKVREGWHCLPKPEAPHLSMKGRQWFVVNVAGVEKLARPHGQGTMWYIADEMKIVRPYENR